MSRTNPQNVVATVAIGLVVLGSASVFAAAPEFERDVAPFLANYCLDCHRPGKNSAKLILATQQGLCRREQVLHSRRKAGQFGQVSVRVLL